MAVSRSAIISSDVISFLRSLARRLVRVSLARDTELVISNLWSVARQEHGKRNTSKQRPSFFHDPRHQELSLRFSRRIGERLVVGEAFARLIVAPDVVDRHRVGGRLHAA